MTFSPWQNLCKRDRRLVTVFHRPDDVLRAERGVAAEKDVRPRRLERDRVDLGHVPLVELQAQVVLDPGKGVLLADREDHVVAGEELLGDDTLGGDAAVGIEIVFHDVEHHADQLAAFADERLGRVIDDDLDVLGFGVFQFPLGRFEELARLARHDLHVVSTQSQ